MTYTVVTFPWTARTYEARATLASRRRRVEVQLGGDECNIVLVQQALKSGLLVGEPGGELAVEGVQFDRGRLTVLVSRDEHEIEDPDDAGLDE